jgi:arginyl-tRNA synthetase
MNLEQILQEKTKEALLKIYDFQADNVELQATRKDFEGDITLVVFPYVKQLRKNPKEVAESIGDFLQKNIEIVKNYNVVGGFLNLVIDDRYYTDFLNSIYADKKYGLTPQKQEKALMVEYSSPNTNKPLHLGHIRNNLLGHSISEIYKATGKPVIKTQIINDRGIHICKSMLAWQKFGNGETPESSGMKGDHLAGKYYVKFDQEYKKQIQELIKEGKTEEEAKKQAPILLEAQEMLRKWEAKEPEVIQLWQKMNGWVYEGFNETYKNLGVSFDKNYYESETYLLGKKVVEEGLKKGIFFQKPDGSVWADLSDEGLDEKLLLRADGTSVYMTQDIGTAIKRFEEFDIDSHIYVVGNEQDYHFQVLFLILKKLGYKWADKLYHLSYGMVELPHGKMKSREGTVVDADDLMQEMTDTAREISQELGKLEGYSPEEKERLYRIIGLGALKYYILKVDPKRTIMFDPKKSIDFQGNTGPFIQYTYARIQSILRKSDGIYQQDFDIKQLDGKEKEVLKQLETFPQIIETAAQQQNPGIIANYTYDLVKLYNSFYQSVPILSATDENARIFRVKLSAKVGDVIQNAFKLLGIEVPERM